VRSVIQTTELFYSYPPPLSKERGLGGEVLRVYETQIRELKKYDELLVVARVLKKSYEDFSFSLTISITF